MSDILNFQCIPVHCRGFLLLQSVFIRSGLSDIKSCKWLLVFRSRNSPLKITCSQCWHEILAWRKYIMVLKKSSSVTVKQQGKKSTVKTHLEEEEGMVVTQFFWVTFCVLPVVSLLYLQGAIHFTQRRWSHFKAEASVWSCSPQCFSRNGWNCQHFRKARGIAAISYQMLTF